MFFSLYKPRRFSFKLLPFSGPCATSPRAKRSWWATTPIGALLNVTVTSYLKTWERSCSYALLWHPQVPKWMYAWEQRMMGIPLLELGQRMASHPSGRKSLVSCWSIGKRGSLGGFGKIRVGAILWITPLHGGHKCPLGRWFKSGNYSAEGYWKRQRDFASSNSWTSLRLIDWLFPCLSICFTISFYLVVLLGCTFALPLYSFCCTFCSSHSTHVPELKPLHHCAFATPAQIWNHWRAGYNSYHLRIA